MITKEKFDSSFRECIDLEAEFTAFLLSKQKSGEISQQDVATSHIFISKIASKRQEYGETIQRYLTEAIHEGVQS